MVDVVAHEEMQKAWKCIDIFRAVICRLATKVDMMDAETKQDIKDVDEAMGEWY